MCKIGVLEINRRENQTNILHIHNSNKHRIHFHNTYTHGYVINTNIANDASVSAWSIFTSLSKLIHKTINVPMIINISVASNFEMLTMNRVAIHYKVLCVGMTINKSVRIRTSRFTRVAIRMNVRVTIYVSLQKQYSSQSVITSITFRSPGASPAGGRRTRPAPPAPAAGTWPPPGT